MLDKIKKTSDRKKFIIVLSIIFIMFFALNILTPILGDDYLYSFYGDNRVKSIMDIILNQYNHYFGWGGRSIVHFIAQLFLMFNKNIFNVANTLAFIALIILIYLHSNSGKKYNVTLLIIITLLLWNFIPMFGQTTLWLTGSCNYLWGTVIVLLFLLPYRYSIDKSIKMNWIETILFTVSGIIAGWTNENTSAATIFIIFLILLKKLKEKDIKVWQITAFITSILGFALMILAPGNFARADTIEESTNKIIMIIKRIFVYTNQANNNLLVIIVILAILFAINYYKNKKDKKMIHITALFLLGGVIGVYSMVLSPIFPDRAYFGIITFLIIAISFNLNSIIDDKIFKNVIKAVYIVLIPSLLFSYSYLLKDLIIYTKIFNERTNQIEQYKSEKKYNIEFDIYRTTNKRSPLFDNTDVGLTPNDNLSMAKYYGMDSVIGK